MSTTPKPNINRGEIHGSVKSTEESTQWGAFAFVGSQVPLVVGGETLYLDLLFYHLRLHAYIVIELKTGTFKPEHVGKLTCGFASAIMMEDS